MLVIVNKRSIVHLGFVFDDLFHGRCSDSNRVEFHVCIYTLGLKSCTN
jgi:hypothetical protein